MLAVAALLIIMSVHERVPAPTCLSQDAGLQRPRLYISGPAIMTVPASEPMISRRIRAVQGVTEAVPKVIEAQSPSSIGPGWPPTGSIVRGADPGGCKSARG